MRGIRFRKQTPVAEICWSNPIKMTKYANSRDAVHFHEYEYGSGPYFMIIQIVQLCAYPIRV
jgi:hypothetical protein